MKKLILAVALCSAPLFAAKAEPPAAPPASPSAGTPAVAPGVGPAVTPAVISAKDQVELAKITDYLNKLKTISADFLQVDDAGGMLRGTIAISRPGKMRVNYAPPNNDFIIADGSYVHIWDDQLQSQSNVEQGTSLAEFILRDPINLTGDVTVTKFLHFPAKLEVTLVQRDDPGAGSLTLVFEESPLKLRQWKVIDPQGRTTGVTLENMTEGMTFPASTFEFIPPNFGKK